MADSLQSGIEARLRNLLDRAGSEPDKARFYGLLREIGQLLDVRAELALTRKKVATHNTDSSTFDIFSGVPDRDAVWMESVVGMEEATERMWQIAAASPGDYFVFDVLNHSVRVRANTAAAHPGEIQNSPYRKRA